MNEAYLDQSIDSIDVLFSVQDIGQRLEWLNAVGVELGHALIGVRKVAQKVVVVLGVVDHPLALLLNCQQANVARQHQNALFGAVRTSKQTIGTFVIVCHSGA